MNQSGISSEALNHISHPLQEEHLNLGPLLILQKQIFSDPPPEKYRVSQNLENVQVVSA